MSPSTRHRSHPRLSLRSAPCPDDDDPPTAGISCLEGFRGGRHLVPGEALRRALSPSAAGVVVVTAGATPLGVTVSSFTSVSLEPPLVSFCLGVRSRTAARLLLADVFAVNVLAEDQIGLARRFAASDVDRFAPSADRFGPPTDWRAGPHGVPLLAGTAARLVCEQHDLVSAGDHVIVLGQVLHAEGDDVARPLLHHRGRFTAVRVEAGRDEAGRDAGAARPAL